MKLAGYIFIFSLLFLGCSPEYIVRKNYEGDLSAVSIMLIFPDHLDAINTKSGLDLQSIDDYTYDSLFYAADFLPYIYRDSFLQDFKRGVSTYLKNGGFKVYTEDDWSEFLSANSTSYIYNFTYLQLEEHFTTFLVTAPSPQITLSNQESRSPPIFVKLKNTLSLNAWVEYSYVQDTASQTYTYFTNSELSDQIKGSFVKDEGKHDYIYQIDSLKLKRAQQLDTIAASEMGKTAIDFMINQTMENYIGSYFNRYPNYYLDFRGKGDIRKTETAPNYIFLKVE